MRNFDSMRTAIADRGVRTDRLGIVSRIVANARSAHRALLMSQNACRRSFAVRSDGIRRDADNHLVNSAGLTLMGYPDTSGAPLANLRR